MAMADWRTVVRNQARLGGHQVALMRETCDSAGARWCGCQQGGTFMPRQIITSANAPSSPLYSQGVKAGPREEEGDCCTNR